MHSPLRCLTQDGHLRLLICIELRGGSSQAGFRHEHQQIMWIKESARRADLDQACGTTPKAVRDNGLEQKVIQNILHSKRSFADTRLTQNVHSPLRGKKREKEREREGQGEGERVPDKYRIPNFFAVCLYQSLRARRARRPATTPYERARRGMGYLGTQEKPSWVWGSEIQPYPVAKSVPAGLNIRR